MFALTIELIRCVPQLYQKPDILENYPSRLLSSEKSEEFHFQKDGVDILLPIFPTKYN